MARIPPHFTDDAARLSAKTLRETCHFLAPWTQPKSINVINRNVWKDTRGKAGREEQEGWSLEPQKKWTRQANPYECRDEWKRRVKLLLLLILFPEMS